MEIQSPLQMVREKCSDWAFHGVRNLEEWIPPRSSSDEMINRGVCLKT